MQIRSFKAALVAAALVGFSTSAMAAPTAKQYQASLTSPTGVTGATIKITKPSKIIVKGGTGSVTLQLKLAGVTDVTDTPVTLANNSLQVDILRPNGAPVTLMFLFTITDGKLSQKFPLANAAFPGGQVNPGETIDIRRVHLLQGGNGNDFGVAGITIK